jgi:hypothetical protein
MNAGCKEKRVKFKINGLRVVHVPTTDQWPCTIQWKYLKHIFIWLDGPFTPFFGSGFNWVCGSRSGLGLGIRTEEGKKWRTKNEQSGKMSCSGLRIKLFHILAYTWNLFNCKIFVFLVIKAWIWIRTGIWIHRKACIRTLIQWMRIRNIAGKLMKISYRISVRT